MQKLAFRPHQQHSERSDRKALDDHHFEQRPRDDANI
jgi:hypothetical protein